PPLHLPARIPAGQDAGAQAGAELCVFSRGPSSAHKGMEPFKHLSVRSSVVRKEAVEWLTALGRLWGLVRFRHPWLAEQRERWDAGVAAAIPGLARARTDRAAERIVAAALSTLDDSATALLAPSRPLGERRLLIERPHERAAILLLRNLDLRDWYTGQDRL